MIKTLLLLFAIVTLSIPCKAQKNTIIASDATPTRIQSGYGFTEGPAADEAGNVYFTDQPNDAILKWDAETNVVSTYMSKTGRANGLYVDNEGNLLAAADEHNELWRIYKNKNVSVLLDNFENKKFNGPNDLWVDATGGIYFTDPYYKRPYWKKSFWKKNKPRLAKQEVYYLPPNKIKPTVVATDFVRPNGIIGTPDGKTIYIADIGDKKTYKYTIDAAGKLSNRELFADLGSDGMTLDNQGNVYLTGDGVTVFNAQGEQIAHIDVPENWTANVTFGGKEQNILFITASKSVYSLPMLVKGVRW